MRAIELSYDAYLDGRFPGLAEVRSFPAWQVLAAQSEGRFVLILDEREARRATVLEYEDRSERQQDILLVQRLSFRDEGDADAGVPAFLQPVPPARPACDARLLPEIDGEDNGA